MASRKSLTFPSGESPDYWNPNPEHKDHRFALGRVLTPTRSRNPLVVIAMNPSYADHSESDKTVNTVIAASSTLGHDGWIMLNLYPERATKPSDLGAFDAGLWARNWTVIEEVLDTFEVKEVLGAWGNPPNQTIREALKRTRSALHARSTRSYHFGDLTTLRSPRHPTPHGGVWDLSGPKRYLS